MHRTGNNHVVNRADAAGTGIAAISLILHRIHFND